MFKGLRQAVSNFTKGQTTHKDTGLILPTGTFESMGTLSAVKHFQYLSLRDGTVVAIPDGGAVTHASETETRKGNDGRKYQMPDSSTGLTNIVTMARTVATMNQHTPLYVWYQNGLVRINLDRSAQEQARDLMTTPDLSLKGLSNSNAASAIATKDPQRIQNVRDVVETALRQKNGETLAAQFEEANAGTGNTQHAQNVVSQQHGVSGPIIFPG